jgi:hypothetical protein
VKLLHGSASSRRTRTSAASLWRPRRLHRQSSTTVAVPSWALTSSSTASARPWGRCGGWWQRLAAALVARAGGGRGGWWWRLVAAAGGGWWWRRLASRGGALWGEERRAGRFFRSRVFTFWSCVYIPLTKEFGNLSHRLWRCGSPSCWSHT